ncbi:pre-mRNA processing RNA-helicase, partial [Quaeritorhiza haematococci]
EDNYLGRGLDHVAMDDVELKGCSGVDLVVVHFGPLLKTVHEQEHLTEEEKKRLRRERLAQWRAQKLQNEQQQAGGGSNGTSTASSPKHGSSTDQSRQSEQQQVPPTSSSTPAAESPAGTSTAVEGVAGSKRKAWSLDDENDDGGDSSSRTSVGTPSESTSEFQPPSLKPFGKKPMTSVGGFTKPAVTKPTPKPSFLGGKTFGRPFLKATPFMRTSTTTTTAASSTSVFSLDDGEEEEKGLQPLPKRKLQKFDADAMEVDSEAAENGAGETSSENKMDMDEDEVDALDAFMENVTTEVRKITEMEAAAAASSLAQQQQNRSEYGSEKGDTGGGEGDDETVPEKVESDDPEDIIAAAAKKLASKRKDLAPVDHASIKYEPFRKDFFIEPPELAEMTDKEVELKRAELDGIKIRGKDCPKPVDKWTQFGLPLPVLEVIRKVLKYEKPSPIQAQAIPAVMSGRDVIGIAKTGSGKTIAFLLPMFRHIKDQRPLEPMEGPVALIMTPTRELAVQIHRECKPFTKVLNLRAVCAYGGSPIKDQIADLKRGAEIIICTPGRMIDLLCANSGRVTNLRRVTYLVLDEADRMFDMGFEPQVMKIVNNVRPDRQTVLFSATFPKQMEALARKILRKPLEITVGGRSVVCADVTQYVEIRDEDTKFVRLLEILGHAFNEDPDAKVLIFTDRHEAADNMLRDLFRRGYPCQSLHGGKDQADRDSTIADFKTGNTNILIATSVAARGLDVKQLKIVVNYECPNHMEDYVHRVGRTGRAGNKGTAYTFITPEQDRYAVDILKALKLSGAPVPDDLQKLADEFIAKVKSGNAKYSGSGFGGKGLERLDKERDMLKKIQKKTHGGDLGDEEEEEEEEEKIGEFTFEAKLVVAEPAKKEEGAAGAGGAEGGAAGAAAAPGATAAATVPMAAVEAARAAALAAAARINENLKVSGSAKTQDILSQINKLTAAHKDDKADASSSAGAAAGGAAGASGAGGGAAAFAYEIPINDYPQKARWRVTNKEQISQITELTGAAITTRGTYFPPGKTPGPNERKLYLFVEGETQLVIDHAKSEIKRILIESTLASMESDAASGRYTVV